MFDQTEINREKQVVLQEIKMVEDDPEDLVHELHTQNVWKGNPLGRSILGSVKTVQEISRREIIRYLKKYYHPERIVISVAGNFSTTFLMKRLNKVFGRFKGQIPPPTLREAPHINGRFLIKKKPLTQVHICLGLKGLPLIHQDRYVVYGLNTLLGGSMSSRLFQEIREKRGLAYSIYSSFSGFQDAGLFTIYAAVSQKFSERVLHLILRGLKLLRDEGVGRSELNRTLAQLKGNIMLGLESTNSRMSRLARDEIYFGRYFSLKEMLGEIGKINRPRIHRLADELLDRHDMSLTILGPLRSNFKSIQTQLT